MNFDHFEKNIGFNNIVKFIINNGPIDVNARNKRGETAFFMATERGSSE